MTDFEYQAALKQLGDDWGEVYVDPNSPGVLRAYNDPTTGLLAGVRAPMFAEMINRAIESVKQ